MKYLQNYKIFENKLDKINDYVYDLKYWLIDHQIIVTNASYITDQLCIQLFKNSSTENRYFHLDDICDYINTAICLIESEGLILQRINYNENNTWKLLYREGVNIRKNNDIFDSFDTNINIGYLELVFFQKKQFLLNKTEQDIYDRIIKEK